MTAQALPPGASFFRGHRTPVIIQTEAAECGLACLAMVASYHGHRTDMNSLRRRYPVSLKGATLRDLKEIAAHLGLACRPLRIEVGHLCQLRLPAILHWDMAHFIVLKACKKDGIVVHDPAAGNQSSDDPKPSVPPLCHASGVPATVLSNHPNP